MAGHQFPLVFSSGRQLSADLVGSAVGRHKYKAHCFYAPQSNPSVHKACIKLNNVYTCALNDESEELNTYVKRLRVQHSGKTKQAQEVSQGITMGTRTRALQCPQLNAYYFAGSNANANAVYAGCQ